MADKGLIENAWVDIVPPAVPAYSAELLVILALILLALIAGGLFYIYSRPRQQARRKLRQLSRQLLASRAELNAVSFRLRDCLRTAYACDDLQDIRFEQSNRQDWQSYLDKLSRFSFSPYAPTADELTLAINEAQAWIKLKVVPN